MEKPEPIVIYIAPDKHYQDDASLPEQYQFIAVDDLEELEVADSPTPCAELKLPPKQAKLYRALKELESLHDIDREITSAFTDALAMAFMLGAKYQARM